MNKYFFNLLGLALSLLITGLFISCQKEEDGLSGDVDNFVQVSTRGIEHGFGVGLTGCYELVFPVTVQFPDSTIAEVADYPALKQALHDWFVANGGVKPLNRPTLVYPIQVINRAGEIITVETPEEMKELILLCKPVFVGGGHHHGGGDDSIGGGHHGGGNDTIGGGHHGGGDHGGGPGVPCFTIVFPLTISFPDSSQVTVNSPGELKQATFTWNKNNPGQHAHPQFVFPITVTLSDGTQVVVNSQDELRAIKENCRG